MGLDDLIKTAQSILGGGDDKDPKAEGAEESGTGGLLKTAEGFLGGQGAEGDQGGVGGLIKTAEGFLGGAGGQGDVTVDPNAAPHGQVGGGDDAAAGDPSADDPAPDNLNYKNQTFDPPAEADGDTHDEDSPGG